MEPNKFAVGNQEANVRALHLQRREAVIRADAVEISDALCRTGFDEFVADALAAAERIEHMFPVAFAKDERLAVLLLPPEQFGLLAPSRIEMEVLDAPNVVNEIHK